MCWEGGKEWAGLFFPPYRYKVIRKGLMGKGLYKLKAFVLILYIVIVCTYVSHVKLILRINMFKLSH